MPRSGDALVEESVARLDAISQRRNVLLREMHQMIQRRNNLGSVFTLEDEDEEDLQIFLKRFIITKDDPETGSISNLGENEIFASTSREAADVSRPPSSRGRPPFSRASRGRHIASSPKFQTDSHGLFLPRQALPSTSAADPSGKVISESLQSRPDSVRLPLQHGLDDGEDELDLLRKSPPARAPLYSSADLAHRDEHPATDLATGATVASGQTVPSTPTDPGAVAQGHTAAVAVSPGRDSDGKNVLEAAVPTKPQDKETLDKPPVSTVDPRELIVDRPSQVSEDVVMSDELQYPQADNLEHPARETLPGSHDMVSASLHGRHTFLPAIANPVKRPVIVLSIHTSRVPEREYVFSEPPPPPPPQPAFPATATPIQRRLQFSQSFTVPPFKAMNPDYVRKSKSVKRKRDKDRDVNGGRKENGKEDSVSLGLNRWAATLNANPVWKRVSRAPKCLSTREWAIAMSELRLIRAIDRIESLKREGRWSFRQPKKQRAISGVPKTHWDHLMDEMKWMRVDFREERKWKIALAYNLSTAVLDWHAAGTMQVRVAKGICVRWKPPRPDDHDQEMIVDENIVLGPEAVHEEMQEMEVDESGDSHPQQRTSLLGVDYGSDDGEEEEDSSEKDVRNVDDPLEPGILVEDALNEADRSNEFGRGGPQDIQPEAEDVEDGTAPVRHDIEATGDETTAVVVENTKPHTASALKTTSTDPVLTSQGTPSSTKGDADHLSSSSSKSSAKMNIYAPFREIIAYSEDDKLFLDLDEFDIAQLDVPSANVPDDTLLPAPDLTAIFPDLQVFSLLEPAPVVQAVPDGKKRSEKRIDRDDPTKRPDDILYTRLYPTGKFMMTKPTLIGPLRPSKNWTNGQWLPLDETAVAPEVDAPVKISDDSVSDLFEGRSSSAPSVIMAMQLQAAYLKDKDGRKRTADHLWSNADDALLKSLIDKYPNNWPLIAECFNASRLTIPTDKRTPRDCLERWRDKWAPEIRRPGDNPLTVEATPPTSSQMTTRGIKRLASASVSSTTPVGMAAGSEPRKRRRHLLVQETIRKAGKKRAEALQKIQAAQRKPPAIHETHAQYSKLPRRTPAELSRMKAEKESRELHELQQARKKQEELNRHHLMSRMMNGVPQQAIPQQQQQPQVATAMQRPVGTGIPPPSQVVPQIRSQVNISQQQRTNTPSIQGTGRLTQQILQAQARAAHQQQQQQQVQVHAQALAQAQNQIQNNGVNVNGSVPANTPHLSPRYVPRDVTSSPAHMSPPHNSAVPSTVNSPRPPSAQSHPLQATQMPAGAGTRGGYYLPNVTNVVQGYTAEQIHTALRLQHQQQQQQQQLQQQQQQQQQPAQQPLTGFPTQPYTLLALFSSFASTMSSTVQGNVNYDPLPLTSDDNPSNALYNAPPSPDPNISSFHTPQFNPAELGVDSTGYPPGAAQPRFLGAALYDDAGGPHIRNSYASSHNTASGGGSEYTGSVYALNDTLGATPLTHGPYAGTYRDDPNDPYGSEPGALPMSPLGPSSHRLMEEKRAVYAAPRAKSKRTIIILSVLAALILLILAVVIPVYFAIIKPNSNNSSSDDSGAANPTSTGKNGKPPVVAAVTGGDGSTITMEDGTTFTYRNPFGGYWYWDENDPFNNGARAQSWSPALNETFRYGVDQIRGVNIGGWLNTEPFITPALFEPYLQNAEPAVDEWTLSLAMRADTAKGGIKQLEDHYKTFITEKDFADIAGAGLNYVRIPIGYWAIEVRDGEPFLEKTSWTYFLKAIKWARKYGIRINLDLHSVPGSQNGWNHSGRLGTVNFLNGPMGYANAQRALDYIRIIAEFIAQPQYRNVVTMFGIINEPQGSVVGRDALSRFYLEAYNIIRKAGGTGENNGPYVSIHDGFFPRKQWADVFPNADRLALDSHPYICFGDQSSATMDTYRNTPCTTWGGDVNNSMSAFGLTAAGEFSNAVTDCGLWLNGVNLGTRYEGTYPGSGARVGDCTTWTDWQKYDAATKAAIKNFALASMDALQNYFFWTWKIGNSSVTGKVETPAWSYQLGLENGWMPKDPREAQGFCGNPNPWTPPLAPWQTGGAGAGNIPAAVSASLAWPPPVISNGGPISSLPSYTPTGTVVTLPPPTFTHSGSSTATATVDAGSGWANPADNDGMYVPVASCSYLDPWIGPNAAPPSPLCGAGSHRRDEAREPIITPAPTP
ncbi:putative glycoside hydrolase family 5 protein [Lyophyllum shimeji]|uniref:glucan 1,3-beta-glucosidase n=1 Tax=Lyophyllum shimeji TaxID=47721 RepID=A0A9P3PFI1_LYOSH|nr:putative glycoside hydrolase family 5 protein [Lyophyllum shimeji]